MTTSDIVESHLHKMDDVVSNRKWSEIAALIADGFIDHPLWARIFPDLKLREQLLPWLFEARFYLVHQHSYIWQ